MKTMDVVIRDVTAEATFHLPVLADLLCPPGNVEPLEDRALQEMDYLNSLEQVLDRIVHRLEELDPTLNVTAGRANATPRQRACQKVVNTIRDLEEMLILYLDMNFGALVGQKAACEEGG
ncbi:hypothetical protein ANRL4_04019 [Anaerolineae bacterium]|nr:hypothetical protein ANRL4_04019 [Anaerolineae bacterium]